MDEKVKTKPAKYRKMVEKKRGLRSCYCITLPMNEKNCMVKDYVNAGKILKSRYDNYRKFVGE